MTGKFIIERIRDGVVIERHESECEVLEGRSEVIETSYVRLIGQIIFPEPITVRNGEELRIVPAKE